MKVVEIKGSDGNGELSISVYGNDPIIEIDWGSNGHGDWKQMTIEEVKSLIKDLKYVIKLASK